MCLLQKMCFSLGMTINYIWDCSTPHVCVVTEEEFDRITKGILFEFLKGGEKNRDLQKV